MGEYLPSSAVTDEDLKKSTNFIDFVSSGRKWALIQTKLPLAASIVRLLDISF
jgi:hypothetical protein